MMDHIYPRNHPPPQQASPDISQKKTRGKYASKACVECRNRKPKCDGTEPCTRCVRTNHRCIFSDDRVMADVLRQARQPAIGDGMNGHSPLDARVERLELAMQALTERLDCEDASKTDYEQDVSERMDFQGEFDRINSQMSSFWSFGFDCAL